MKGEGVAGLSFGRRTPPSGYEDGSDLSSWEGVVELLGEGVQLLAEA